MKVYRGANKDPEQTYHVPLGSGSEPYWTVFKMTVKEGSITFNAINQLTSSNPLQTAFQLGNVTALKSSVFKVYDGPRWIGEIPRGTTVEAFKKNMLPVDSGAHYELYAGDSSTVRTGAVENFDMLVVTAANGITKQTYTVRTLDNVPVDSAIGAVRLYASPDNTVTGAVYSQPIGTGTNTQASPFHIPASAKYLLIQFNQELAASQDGLKIYADGSLVSAGSIRLLPERILSVNVTGFSPGRDIFINIVGLKKAGGNAPGDPLTIYVSKPSQG